MWKATERKKAAPPPKRRRVPLWAVGLALLLIPSGLLGFGGSDGALGDLSRILFFVIATVVAVAFAASRRRSA